MITSLLRSWAFDEAQGLRAQLLRGGIGSMGVKVVGTLLGFVVAVTLARVLGPEGYGIYAFAFAVVTLLAIPAKAGLPQLVIRETAKARVHEDWALMLGIWRWATRFVLLFSVVLLLVVVTALWLMRDALEPARLAALATGALLIPLLALGNLRGAALQGLRRVVMGQLPEHVLRPAAFVLLISLALVLGFRDEATPYGAMALHVVAAAMAFLVGIRLLASNKPAELREVSQAKYAKIEWRRAVAPLALISGFQLVNMHADILLLGLMRTDAEVGVYRVVTQTASLVVFGLSALNVVLQPHFSRLYAQGNLAQLQQLVTNSARAILGLALIPVLPLLLMGGLLLGWVFGSGYAIGGDALRILAAGQLINAAVGSVAVLLNMTGHERDTLCGVALAAGVNILLNLALIPPLGMEGAAVATSVSLLIWNLFLWRMVRHRLGLNSLALSVGSRRTPL